MSVSSMVTEPDDVLVDATAEPVEMTSLWSQSILRCLQKALVTPKKSLGTFARLFGLNLFVHQSCTPVHSFFTNKFVLKNPSQKCAKLFFSSSLNGEVDYIFHLTTLRN